MLPKSGKTNRTALLTALCISGLFSACAADTGTATGSVCPADSTLTYENFGLAFLQTNCISCHGSREQPTLTTQAAVQANIDAIDRQAAAGPNAVNTIMPDGASVSTADRTKLGEWLACGAP